MRKESTGVTTFWENWTVNGLEFPAHDGRTLNGQGLGFATTSRGVDHMYAEMYDYEYLRVEAKEALRTDGLNGKAKRLIALENENAINDSEIICKFPTRILTEDRYETLFDTDTNNSR